MFLTKRWAFFACAVGAVLLVSTTWRTGPISRRPSPADRMNYYRVSVDTDILAYNVSGTGLTGIASAHPVTETGQTGQAHVSHVGVHSAGRAPVNHSVNVNSSSELNHKARSASFPDSYLGVVAITEQLSANTENYVQLVYMSMLWNLSIIDPVINEHSYLSSIPPSSGKHIPFGYVFNMTAVAQRVQSCLHMPSDFYFHSLDEALVHSSRDVLVLRFMVSHMTVKLKECNDRSESTVKEIIVKLNSHVEKVKDQAREIHGDKYLFRPWKAVCVKAIPNVPFSVNKLKSFLKDLMQKKKNNTGAGVMVVVPEWRKVKNIKSGHYYYDPNLAYNATTCNIDSFAHSDLVVKAAEKFLNSIHLSRPFLGVYVRTERLVGTEYAHRGFMDKCFKKFKIVVEQVKKMFNISDIALVSDVGPHGSRSFSDYARNKANDIVSKLKSWKMNSYHYDPKSFKDFPQLSVFVASVEKEFLSRSDVLITLGSGGFSHSVAGHFRVRSSTDRLFTMCKVF